MINNAELGYTPKNLKALRAAHNLTQQQVADITGVTWRMVSRWEQEITSGTVRSDMPYTKWVMLTNYAKKQK